MPSETDDIREQILIAKELNDNGPALDNVEVFFTKEEEAQIAEIDMELMNQEAMIDLLQSLMLRIAAGKVKGIAFALCSDKDVLSSGWEGAKCRHTLGHAISLLGSRYNLSCLESLGPPEEDFDLDDPEAS